MLKSKFLYFCLAVFLLNLVVSIAQLTIKEARSCSGCKATGKKWCGAVTESDGTHYQGCITSSSTCPPSISTESVSCGTSKLSANCGGCVAAGHVWCVVNGDVTGRKCVEKQADSSSSKAHPDCINGDVYEACTGQTRIPGSTELVPNPVVQTCEDCKLITANAWCRDNRPDVKAFIQHCIAKDPQQPTGGPGCQGGYVKDSESCSTTEAHNVVEYSVPPKDCKNCIVKAEHHWCSKSQIVGFAACLKSSEKAKCHGGKFVRTCEKPDETPAAGNLISMTCKSCKEAGKKWCRKDDPGNDAVVARKCFSGSCPSGSNEVETCPDSFVSFTHLPAVPQDLPTKCSDCKNSQTANSLPVNSWCKRTDSSSSNEFGTCLPSWSFAFYCTTTAATCASSDQSRSFEDNPFYLRQSCDGCVMHGDEWCRTDIDNYKYQFCTPEDRKSLCGGDNPIVVKNCKGLKSEEKKALIPTPIPRTCEACISKGGWRWCVHSGFGDKIRMCLPKEVADKLCNSEIAVAFHHCNIAPEDKKLELGLFKILFDGSSFVSLSVMAIAVTIGFSFF